MKHRLRGLHRVLEAQAHARDAANLVKDPFGQRRGTANHRYAREDERNKLVDVGVAEVRQGDRDTKGRKVGVRLVLARHQLICPAAPLEQREERALALVAENVRDVAKGLGAVKAADGRQRPRKS